MARIAASPASVGILVAALVITGCLGPGREEDDSGSQSLIPSQLEQPDDGWHEVEVAVLEALDDEPHAKSIVYEPDRDRVLVTLFTEGPTPTRSQIEELEVLGREAAGGVDVVIECSDEGAPEEDV